MAYNLILVALTGQVGIVPMDLLLAADKQAVVGFSRLKAAKANCT